MFIEIPILGSIVDFPNMLSAVDFTKVKKQQPYEQNHPLYIFDPAQHVQIKPDHIDDTFMAAPLLI